jgi:cytochrome c-type biogenesis protein CcmE
MAGPMLKVADLLSNPDQYDKQMVMVVGQATNIQTAANRQGQLAYGFVLKDQNGSVKVVGIGKAEVREGDQVIVEGIFNRLRQVGRAIVHNEIKASVVRPVNRLTPDLVG